MAFKYSVEMDTVSLAFTDHYRTLITYLLVNDYPTGRFLRDAKLMEIGAGTTEIRKLILGRHFNELYSEN